MIPSELRLDGLGHCFIHLSRAFLQKEPSIKPGCIICIKSVRNDTELMTIWNGQLTNDNMIHLDSTFARANKFEDEIVVVSLINDSKPSDCSTCRAEVIEASDFGMISQHLFANVLDKCRLVYRGFCFPIWLSQHVTILVKIVDVQPINDYVMLTQWTEMQFIHSFDNTTTGQKQEEIPIIEPIPFVSFTLGLGNRPKIYPGALLICGGRGSGKTHLLKQIIKNYRKYPHEILNCKHLRGKRIETIKKTLTELLNSSISCQPSILALDDIDSILSSDQKHEDEKSMENLYRKRLVDLFCYILKQLERTYQLKGQLVLLIASCRSLELLDPRISAPKGRSYFGTTIKIEEPNLERRKLILSSILSDHKQVKSDLNDDQMELVARNCNSYMPSDLKCLIERAVINASSRWRHKFSSDPIDIQVDDLLQSTNNFVPSNLRNVSLKTKTSRNFDSVGGMNDIKESLTKMILLPLKYPKLFRRYPIRPQTSVMLYGPPGCGKTLIAEALTNQAEINSICIRGPELLSKYIGASEGAVRDLFKRAQAAKPCVIFFDEFESLVARRGSDSTGVTDRVVNQFLTLMDGVDQLTSEIFIVAATSRPDIIDPAILRPGRIDKHIYCPLPNELDRLDILDKLTQKMKLKGVDLKNWSTKIDRFTGADIQSLLYSSQIKALHEILDTRKSFESDSTNQIDIVVEERHLASSFEEMVAEINKKYNNLVLNYPKSFKKSIKNKQARVTLA